MTGAQSEVSAASQAAGNEKCPPVQNWEGVVSELLPVLAETASIRLGLEVELEYGGTQAASEYQPSSPGIFISLAVGGLFNGSVHLPLSVSLAHNLAHASLALPDPSEVDETKPLDEARAQALEDLVAVLVQTTVDQVGQEHAMQLDVAVSDRDHLPGPEEDPSRTPFLSTPAWQVNADVSLDHIHVGQAVLLIPFALFQNEDLDLEADDFEDEDGSYNIQPEEMAVLVRSSQSRDQGEDPGKEAEEPEDDLEEDTGKENESEAVENTVEQKAKSSPEQTDKETWSGEQDESLKPAQAEGADLEKVQAEKAETKQIIDIHALHTTLLQASYQVEEELGALLGEGFELTDYLSRVITKKDFLHQFQNKIVVTNLAVSGDHYGTAYSIISLADAINLGGKLIMLPQEEISRKVKSGQLKEDEEDAFGEVINILTGAYSHAFGEYFPHKLRLKKDRMTSTAPTKVDISSDEPFPDGEYFLATYQMRLGSQNLDQLNILIPPSLVSLSEQDMQALKKQPSNGATGQGQGTGTIFIPGQEGGGKPAIAVISDDSQQGQVVATSLEEEGVELIQLKLRDKMRERLKSYNVLGAFLVLKNIDDNSLATLIKVRSMLKGRCPLIISGPKWTRAKVIQAVRYGAQDILTNPPDPAQIVDKTHKHMMASAVQ
ncbi:MAG: hypothetical protein R6U55_01210 [Desulfovermiculus sp.]